MALKNGVEFYDIDQIVEKELRASKIERQQKFNSIPEAFGVMYEEYRELLDEVPKIKDKFSEIYSAMHRNELAVKDCIMLEFAIYGLITEAVQLCAMSQKTREMLKETGGANND